jgi:hypothetical protein
LFTSALDFLGNLVGAVGMFYAGSGVSTWLIEMNWIDDLWSLGKYSCIKSLILHFQFGQLYFHW